MALSHEHIGSQIPATIQIYIPTEQNYLSLFAMRYPVRHVSTIFSKLRMDKYIFIRVIFKVIEVI